MSKNQPKIPNLIQELVTTLHANGFHGIIGRWELNSEGNLETKVEIQTTTKKIDAAFVVIEKMDITDKSI